jgi:hypothetical protein
METRMPHKKEDIYFNVEFSTSFRAEKWQVAAAAAVAELIEVKFNDLSDEEKLNLFNLYEKFKEDCKNNDTYTSFRGLDEIKESAKNETLERLEVDRHKHNNFFEGCEWGYEISTTFLKYYIQITYNYSRRPHSRNAKMKVFALAGGLLHAKFKALTFEEKLHLLNEYEKFKGDCKYRNAFNSFQPTEKMEREAIEEALQQTGFDKSKGMELFKDYCFGYVVDYGYKCN